MGEVEKGLRTDGPVEHNMLLQTKGMSARDTFPRICWTKYSVYKTLVTPVLS